MLNASDLTQEQVQQLREWAAAGYQLNDLQKKIVSEFGISATFMDTRFVVIDLDIELVSPEKEQPTEEPKPERIPTGRVDVTVDELVRPSFLVSGNVSFSDGMQAVWGLDQMGRISIDADEVGYQPNEEDMISFQEALRDKLAK